MKSLSKKSSQLAKLQATFLKDTSLPLYALRKKEQYIPVFGDGPATAKIMLLGEAPGKNEALTGKPFVGSAGKILNTLLESAQLDRKKIYITSIVKDRPPANRTPTEQERTLYGKYLLQQIAIIKPKIIVLMGMMAVRFFNDQFDLGLPSALGKIRGKTIPIPALGKTTLFITYHPAVIIYNRSLQDILEADFKTISKLT